jgi:arylsulfatase A-like enzyme
MPDSTGADRGARPNVLLIVSDQHRVDALENHGTAVQTPHLAQLAREGVEFANAYTPIPLCTPARQALLRGKRPETFGGLWNYNHSSLVRVLEPTDYAWPRALQDAGYATAYLGKWHVHPDHDPTSFGYDRYVPESAYGEHRATRAEADGFGPWPGWEGWLGATSPVPVEESRTHWFADETARTIAELAAGGGPWHVRVDFTEPHLPCRPSEPYASMYPPESIPKWPNFDDPLEDKPYAQRQHRVNWHVEDLDWKDWAPAVARYLGMVTQLDDAIGRILAALDAAGARDDTIVVYTTDHGDLCGSHRMLDKHYVMYDEIVRVPLIVRWPGRVVPGTVVQDFVYNMLDLPPTITEATGAEPAPDFHGRSLLPALDGEDREPRTEVISTYNGQQFGLFSQRMLRTNEWKYVWNGTDVDELYDLREDPAEVRNLIHDPRHHDLVAALRARLYQAMRADGDHLFANRWLESQLLENRKL